MVGRLNKLVSNVSMRGWKKYIKEHGTLKKHASNESITIRVVTFTIRPVFGNHSFVSYDRPNFAKPSKVSFYDSKAG